MYYKCSTTGHIPLGEIIKSHHHDHPNDKYRFYADSINHKNVNQLYLKFDVCRRSYNVLHHCIRKLLLLIIMFSANCLDMIDIVMQVVSLLRAEWILLLYVLGEWYIVSEKESTTLKII